MTLFDISEDLLALESLLSEVTGPDGELPPEAAAALEAWFAEIGADRDAKVDNYSALIRSLELRAAARREEMERLALRVRVDENAAKRLKERLKLFCEIQKIKKLETARYRLSVQKNGGKLALDTSGVNLSAIPTDLQKVRIELDTDKVRAALEKGQDVPGCRLLPRGTHLRIA